MKNKRKPIFVPAYMMILPRLIKSVAAISLLLVSISAVRSQAEYPQKYFRSPIDGRILLSGTFGELRAGHFHSGMDIKTDGVSGKKIYAVADGYVSRIKVSATGFGKTLYVTHPNGFVSVYAHLSKFNKKIGPYVKSRHYKYESFELNIFPEKDALVVKKGEVIAYSGNTGGSNGPHLHFEMRLQSTQTPLNPMLFGFEVKDFIRPEINWMKVYPLEDAGTVDGKKQAKVYEIQGWGEEHRIKNNDTLEISGNFALGINTWDKLNDASNKNGVFSIDLYVDDQLYYHHDLDKFDFVETRYINSLLDYKEYKENKRRYQRTEIDPNNALSIYGEVENKGVIKLRDEGIHKLEYVVKDFAGNVSRLHILVDYKVNKENKPSIPEDGKVKFSIEKTNTYTAEGFELELPGSALYRNLWFSYNDLPMPYDAFSRVHRIHNDRTPVHKYFTVTVTPDSIPFDTAKLLLARITEDGDYISYGGEWDDGAIRASLRSFGDYVVLIDTVPPSITSVNIASGRIKPDRETVKVKIEDDLSGIKKFRATLNGSWLLMEYDAKNDLLIYYIDDRLQKGPNEFKVEVTDQRENRAVFTKTLIRK